MILHEGNLWVVLLSIILNFSHPNEISVEISSIYLAEILTLRLPQVCL